MARKGVREKIVRKGADLVHAQGFNATGIQQVLDIAEIPKGSFYYYFKSKDDFGVSVIDYFAANIGEVFGRFLGDKQIPPLQRLEKLFEYYEQEFENSGCTRGCPLGNLALELADTNEKLRKHLSGVTKDLIDRIESCLHEARLEESISPEKDTRDVAHFIFHAFEGAVLNMKVERSIEPYRSFRRYVMDYLRK